MTNDNLRRVHKTLLKEGYTPPSYKKFERDMQDDDNLHGVYETLLKAGYTPPEYEQFKSDMGFANAAAKPQPADNGDFAMSEKELEGKKPSGTTSKPQPAKAKAAAPITTDNIPSVQQMMDEHLERTRMQHVFQKEVGLDEEGNRVVKPKAVNVHVPGTPSPYVAPVYQDFMGNEYDATDPEVQKEADRQTHVQPLDVKQVNREQVADLSKSIDDMLAAAQRRNIEETQSLKTLKDKDATLMQKVGAAMSLGTPGSAPMAGTNPALFGVNSALVESKEVQELKSARRSLENAKRIIKEADIAVQEDAQHGNLRRGTVDFAKGVGRGFGDKLFDASTWDMGATEFVDNLNLMDALKAFDEGKQLTDSQQAMLDAKAVELATNAYFGSYVGGGYKAGGVTAESLPFMLEMMINPASGIGSKAQNMMVRYALRRFGKQALKKNVKKYLASKVAAKVGGDIYASMSLAGTTGSLGVAGDALGRMNGDLHYDVNDEGQSIFAGHDNQKDFFTAYGQAFLGRTIENHSEMVGEYFAPLFGVVGQGLRKGLGKIGLDGVNRFVDDVAASDIARLVTDFEKSAKWNGTIGEFAEEIVGGVENALLVGDQTLDTNKDTGVFNRDNLIDTFRGVAIMGGVLSTIKTAGYRTPKYRARQDMLEADKQAAQIFGNQDTWGAIKSIISEGSDADVQAKVNEVLGSDEYSQEQKQAVLQYLKASDTYKGVLKAEDKRREEQDPVHTDLETSFDNGYTLEGQDKNDAKNNLELQKQKVGEFLPENIISFIDENPIGELSIIMGMEYTDEQKQTVLDYVNAKATYDGMIQQVRDDIDGRIAESDRLIGERISKTDGMIHPAKLKAEERPVYIVGGQVVLSEDGSIDRDKSLEANGGDGMLLIRDENTGKIETADIGDFLSVDAPLDAVEERRTAQEAIRLQFAQQAADEIDGVLPFNDGDVYDVLDEDGQQHTIEIVPYPDADVPEGSVLVSVDDAYVPQVMKREEVQKMTDAYNLARLNEYEQTKAAQKAPSPDISPEEERSEGSEVAATEPQPTEQTADENAMPMVEVNGKMKPDFDTATPERAHQYIYNERGLTRDEADAFVKANIDAISKEIEKQENGAPKFGTGKNEYTDIDDFSEAKAAWQADMDALNARKKYWEDVSTEQKNVITAEREAAFKEQTADAGGRQNELDAQKKLSEKIASAKQMYGDYFDSDFTVPYDAMELVAMNMPAEKLSWEGREGVRGLQQELGSNHTRGIGNNGSTQAFNQYLAKKGEGIGVDKAVHDIWESPMNQLPSGEKRWDTEEIRNAFIDMFRNAEKPSDIRDYVYNNRIRMAEEMRAAEDEAAAMAQMDEEIRQRTGMEPEEYAAWIADLESRIAAQEAYETEVYNKTNTDNDTGTEGSPDAASAGEVQGQEGNAVGTEEAGAGGTGEGSDVAGDGINTAGIFKTSYGAKRNVVYNRHTTDKQPAETAEASLSGEQSGTTPSTSMSAPTQTSADKGTEISANEQENEEISAGSQQNAAIASAEAEVDTNPTEAQKEAGNYKKGHIKIDGYDVTIENPKGSVRRGVDANGKEWEQVMNNTYGYIRGTEGVDGDHIDVFLSDHIGDWNEMVYVVDQVNKDGSFDEHKVMYGFNSADEAREAYLSNYEEGWQGLGAITGVTKEEFKKWVNSSHRKTKPFAEYNSVKATEWQNEAIQPTGRSVLGNLFNQFKGKAKEAIDFLLQRKEGDAVAALHHKDVGDIDLWYGNDKAGLKKIAEKHPDVLDNLQDKINEMKVIKASDNRIILESATHKAVVSKMLGDEKTDNWLLSAYEKKGTSASSSDNETEPEGKRIDTASPQNSLSEGKGTEKSDTVQGNSEKNIDKQVQKFVDAYKNWGTDVRNDALYRTYTDAKGKLHEMMRAMPEDELSAFNEQYGKQYGAVAEEVRKEQGRRLTEARIGESFEDGLQAQGEITGTAKTPKVATDSFTSKEDVKVVLNGVYHDESGYAVATDGRLLVADKSQYDEGNKGKIVASHKVGDYKKGDVIPGNYPKWRMVVDGMEGSNTASVAWDGLRNFLAGVEDTLKSRWKAEKESNGTKESFASWSEPAIVAIRMPNGEICVYNYGMLRAFADAAASMGMSEITYGAEKPLKATNDNGVVMLMPVNPKSIDEEEFGHETEGRRLYYEWEGAEKAQEKTDANGNVVLFQKVDGSTIAREADAAEDALRDEITRLMRAAGIEVSTDWEEGQRVLDEANGNAKMMAVRKNIENGINALQRIAEGEDSVPNAMTRDDLSQYGGDNQITFLYGDMGNPEKGFKKGYGISHIGAKHGGAETLLRILNVIANGRIDRYVPANKTIVLTDGEYEAVLALTRFGNKETWLFNGWRKDEKTGADGEVSTHSDATQANPTFSREDLGAVLSDANIQTFIETAIQNDEKLREMRFFRTSNGEAYGFTLNGKIYLDPRIATSETPIHEYAHLWAQALRQANPEAWEKLKEEMRKEQDVMDYVKRLYPEITDEDELLEEVFTHYSGKRGAERLRNEMREEMAKANGIIEKARVATVFAKLRDMLSRFWNMARDLFAGRNENLANMKGEDFADMMMNDLMSGFDPRGKAKETAARDKEYAQAVEAGDMEKAQQMVDEAAKAAMPDTKIVDENGNPIVLYHGTTEDFTVFDRTKGRANMDIQGMFFSPWELDAKGYGQNVRKFYVNITNPASFGEALSALRRFQGKENAGVKAREYLISKGYDGVNNDNEEYIAFFPEQIKSADAFTYDDAGNLIPLSRRFDESNNDIRYQFVGEKGAAEAVTSKFEELSKRYNSKPYTIVKFSEVSDEDFLDAIGATEEEKSQYTPEELHEEVLELKNTFIERHSAGGYSRSNRKIAIFAENIPLDRVEEFFFHENMHGILHDLYEDGARGIAERFLEAAPKEGGFVDWAFIEKGYKEKTEQQKKEEFFAYSLSRAMSQGRVGEILEMLNEEDRERLGNILNIIGYDRQSEEARRRQEDEDAPTDRGRVFEGQLHNRGELGRAKEAEGGNEVQEVAQSEKLYRRREPQPRQAGAVTDEQVRELNAQISPTLFREGGYVPNYEESLAMSKAAGYTKKQHDAWWKRTQRNMRSDAEDAVKKLHLEGIVDIYDDADGLNGLSGVTDEDRKSKGWFDPKTGKIVIILGNHASPYDVLQTMLHEGVNHYGLRELFGKNFNTFLDNVYENATPEIRAEIARLARNNGWNFHTATEEYLGKLAEDTDFENAEKKGWWHEIKKLFFDMLHSIGLSSYGGAEISDNELRYILWRSYQNLVNPGSYRNLFDVAKDIAKQYELGVGRFAKPAADAVSTVVAETAAGVQSSFGDEFSFEQKDEILKAYQRVKDRFDAVAFINTPIGYVLINEDAKLMRNLYSLDRKPFVVIGKEMLDEVMQLIRSGKKVAIIDDIPNVAEGRLHRAGDGMNSIWSDRALGLQEQMTETVARLANENSEDKVLRGEAMRAIGANLSDLRKAMSLQRHYDRMTVKRVADLSRILIDGGYLNDLSQQEVKRLLSALKDSTGKEEIDSSVQKVMDIMVDNQLKHAEETLHQLETIKGSKVDARGVEVQGELDPTGQQIIKVFKKMRGEDKDDINNALSEAQERMGSEDAAIAETAALEYAGLQFALEYAENIKASKAEERELRKELENRHAETSREYHLTDEYKEYKQSVEDAIRQNKAERVQAYYDLVSRLSGNMRESMANAAAFKEAEKERVREIQHNANSDMEGRPSNEHYKPKFLDKFVNNPFVRFFFAPLATFDQVLRLLGSKSANGEGYLYNRFMRGWVDARQKEIRGVRSKYAILDAKANELFGSKVKTWGDLIRKVGKMPKASVSFWDGGKMREHELTQGNLLYIYMVNKMLDGRMKLRKMGITEEDVENIERVLDPRLIKLSEWMQEEFLVESRNEYNETHKRMFGAPMAAVEHYFPLKILANARADKPEDLDNPENNEGISTATGSIIKRRRNALALDITGADALNVILDHVAQMEHWNAFAEFNRDINTLRTYKRFRNQVQNMSSVYGSGTTLWKAFNDLCQMAAGTYRPPRGKLDETAVNIAKGVTAAKVSFRLFTALKQLLSAPAYISEARPDYLVKNIAMPWKAWNWGMEHLPIFEERWKSRIAGDPRLMKTELDWTGWRNNVVQIASRIGMSPNAFIDALTVSIGARAIYETKKSLYLDYGYSEEQAEKKAIQDAEIAYNQTQQSSEGAFLSTMQVDRSWLSVLFTIFRNASMAYQRQLHDAIRNIKRDLTPGNRNKSIEFMAKQFVRDGIDEEQAMKNANSRYNRQIGKDVVRVAIFGYFMQLLWNMGSELPYLLFGGDDDDKDKKWDDIIAKSYFGNIEGFTGGDVLSDAGKMLVTGDGNPAWLSKDMPISGEMLEILKKVGNKKYSEAFTDIVNLVVQAGIGVNPQSITDAVLAVMDACGGDAHLAHEATIFAARIMQVPQSQLDKLYFDEVKLSGREAKSMTFDQIVKRYAEYKVKRENFFSPWAWNDEERVEKKSKKASEQIKERLENMSDEDADRVMEYNYSGTGAGVSEATRETIGSAKAKRLGGTDYYQTHATTEHAKAYRMYRDYFDMAGDEILQVEVRKAKEGGNKNRESALESSRTAMNDIKKYLVSGADQHQVMEDIRRLRKYALELPEEISDDELEEIKENIKETKDEMIEEYGVE